jgi:type IV secretory pathway VirB4 component
MATTKNSKPTQAIIPIREVRDGVLVLKDGSMRTMLMTSSINFALKSAGEQESIIFQFQQFLNSLNFSIQIFVQSRRLDIRPYLGTLESREKEQVNDLMRIQIREYIEFVRTFTERSNIMTKSFYVIVPYTPPILTQAKRKKGGMFTKTERTKDGSIIIPPEDFEEYRTQLEQRVAVVQQGISRAGVRAVQLGTEEAIEVFYRLFNPGDVEKPIRN